MAMGIEQLVKDDVSMWSRTQGGLAAYLWLFFFLGGAWSQTMRLADSTAADDVHGRRTQAA